MLHRAIFHLSFPVRDLALAKSFYRDYLGATIGRDNGQWADILLFGHQITLHNRPSEVLPASRRGVSHFGLILRWQDWEVLGARLASQHCAYVRPPVILDPNTRNEHGKMLICDPSDNLIEIKSYRYLSTALRIGM